MIYFKNIKNHLLILIKIKILIKFFNLHKIQLKKIKTKQKNKTIINKIMKLNNFLKFKIINLKIMKHNNLIKIMKHNNFLKFKILNLKVKILFKILKINLHNNLIKINI